MSGEAKFRDDHGTLVDGKCCGKSETPLIRKVVRPQPGGRSVSCQTNMIAVQQKGLRPLQKYHSFCVRKKQSSRPFVKPFVNDKEGLELLNVSMVIACLQMYAKDHGVDILEVLTSKVGEEVRTEKSRIEDMKHSFQQTERENKSLHKDLMRIALIQENNKKETNDMKKEIEKYRLNSCTGNTIQHFENEFEKLKLELHRNVREDALRHRKIVKSFQDELASQKEIIIHLTRELEDRKTKLKHLEENSKSCKNLEEKEIFELRCQLREAFEIVQESRVKLIEAKSETELEQRFRTECERKAIEYQNRNEVLQRANDELLMSQTVLQNCLKKLQKMEAELDETRSKNVFLTSNRQTLRREVNGYKEQIMCLEKANNELKTSHNQVKEHYEREVEQRDQRFEKKDELHEIERQKLRKEIKETKEKLTELTIQQQHTVAKLKESEDKLDKTHSQKDVERRKYQELEGKMIEYENSIKLLKDENIEELRSKEQRINQLERGVECKNREIRVLQDSLNKMKHDNVDRTRQTKELKEFEEQLSKARIKLQQVLLKLKTTEDELQATNSEQEHVLLKLNESEKKANEYQTCIQHLEKENVEIITSHKQIIQDLKSKVKQQDNQLSDLQKSLAKIKNDNSDKDKLREELQKTADQLSKLEYKHNQTVVKSSKTEAQLDEARHGSQSEHQTRQELEKKNNELENQVEDMKKKNLQIKWATLAELRDQPKIVLAKSKEAENELHERQTRPSNRNKLNDRAVSVPDLNDKKRPNKLAERYTDYFDNLWGDAYEILEKHFDRKLQTIEVLLEILQEGMHFCKTNARKQLEDLQSVLTFSSTIESCDFPADVRKHLKYCRKHMASTGITSLYEMYQAHLKKSSPQTFKTTEEICPFVKECLEICWLMAIQDPPVVFAPLELQGSELNADIYKPYKRSGTHVSYTVWPALLLHEGGPVLAKGVVQACEEKSETTKQTRKEKSYLGR